MNMPGFSFPTIFAQALTTQVKEGKPDRLCWLNVFTRVGWGGVCWSHGPALYFLSKI